MIYDDDEMIDYLRFSLEKIGIPSGAFTYGHQGMAERINHLLNRPLVNRTYAPGDFTFRLGDERQGVSRRVPVMGDPWFLWAFNNILPEGLDEENFFAEHMQDNSRKALDSILRRYPALRPLRCVADPSEISERKRYIWETETTFRVLSKYHIKQACFESWSYGFNMKHHSGGPPWISQAGLQKTPEVAMGQYYAGYIAFPIGMGGVQEAWSLISETMDETTQMSVWTRPEDIREADLDDSEAVQLGGSMFPPGSREINAILGRKILENAYLPADKNLELLAEPFQGFDDILPLMWARYYLPMDDPFPVPGEMVVMTCKTMPFVVWWFQQTQPFMYAGSWFETEFYSSGVVLDVLEPTAEDADVSLVYKVLCKGEEIWLKPTDFKKYEIGERVAVLKNVPWTGNFSWDQMQFFDFAASTLHEQTRHDLSVAGKTPHELAVPGWWIAPITFYAQEG